MSKRKIEEAQENEDFKKITQLEDPFKQKYKKLRKNLQSSIEKTIRINQASTRELSKRALFSDRIKHIVRQLEELNFLTEAQRKIADKGITEIINSKKPSKKKPRTKDEEDQELIRYFAEN